MPETGQPLSELIIADKLGTELLINNLSVGVGSGSYDGPTGLGLDVSNFSFIETEIIPNGATSQNNIEFFWTDEGLGFTTGRRQVMLDGSATFGATMKFPNEGRLLSLEFTNVGNGFTVSMLRGTNVPGPLSRPYTPVVQNHVAAALGAGATSTKACDRYAAGPAMVSGLGTTNLFNFFIDVKKDTAGNWTTFYFKQVTNNQFSDIIYLPLGTWRTRIQNTGAAAATGNIQVVAIGDNV